MECGKTDRKKSSETPSLDIPSAIDLRMELYKVKRRKKEILREHMYKSIRKIKSATNRRVGKVEYKDPVPRPMTAKEIRLFCEKCPITGMSRFLEKRIRNQIQIRGLLEDAYPIVLAELIQETKEEYSRVIHNACMNLKIKNCKPDYIYKILPYKYLGKTSRYQKYLQTRKRLQLKLILHYPIVRTVLKECVVSLPYELCDLDFNTTLDLTKFQDALKEKIKCSSAAVHEFYNNILLLVDEEQSKKRRKMYTVHYLDACTGLISVHLSRTIAHTILHVVSFTSSKQNEPYLDFTVSFDKSLVLKPSAEEVIGLYHNYIQDIVNIGTNIYVLAQKETRSYRNTYMPLCLTGGFISECKEQVSLNIYELYEPIIAYTNNISSEFAEIYSDINSEQFYDSISDITLDSGCERISYYKSYLSKAAYIPENEYFKLGRVSLTRYKQQLQDGLSKDINDIFDRLSLQHLWEVTDLCATFELIHTRATQKPMTTEELVETGKYMTWIKNEHLEEVTLRVETSLLNLCRIIDLGVLSEEHLELNCHVIHWLDKSLPIIEEYFGVFEQLKYDAEEKLQKVVEDVGVAIKEVYPLLVLLDDMDDITRVANYLKFITLHMSKIRDVASQISWINKEEECLGFPPSSYPHFENLKTYVYPFYHLMKLCLDVQRNLSVWQDGQFENLDHDTTKSSVDKIYEELKKMHKSYREKLRRAQDENLPIRFRGTVDDPDVLNWPAPLKLCGRAMKLLEDFKPSLEIMKIICNKALRKRHWTAISEIAGVDITPNAGTTLRKMMAVDFRSRLNEYEIISSGATKEKQLIDTLRTLRQQWERIKFTLSTFKQIKILIQLEDIEAVVDEHVIRVINMRGSVFVKPHEAEVKDFYTKICQIDDTIDIWGQMQDKFVRLFPIFSAGHLDTIIPKEADLFKKIHKIYNSFIDVIADIQVVIKVVDTIDILEKMGDCLSDLEVIHSGVVTYLETVRLGFPRFYFLDEEELLDVVSRRDPFISQQFLKKIFQGIQLIEIIDCEIVSMGSQLEIVKFVHAIDLTSGKKIEELCLEIETQMVESLKYYVSECNKVYRRSDIEEILIKFPQQVLQIISQVYWTESIETALQLTHSIKLRLYYQKLQENLEHKANIINENQTNLDRLKLKSLITVDLNYKYLMKKILDCRIVSVNQFDWQAHAKYYIQKGVCTVQIMNINQNYLYEYLGNTECIVLTPLTDRYFRTLINAYYSRFNGLIQGVSETGKSQVIKALADIFAVFLMSFCCHQEVGSPTVSRLLKGYSLCGSWICLEGFSALKPEVLSVASQEIYTILRSKVWVNPTCFLSATIDSSKTSLIALPENLKVLFRTITTIVPDLDRIIEVALHCIGFQRAVALSKKLFCFHNVIRDILPARSHYHFGIKILKQAVSDCELLKQKNPNENEEFMVLEALRTLYLQMLVEEDVEIFDSLLRQIFPSISTWSKVNDTCKSYVEDYSEQNNIQCTEKLYSKTVEVYNSLRQASGVIIVGDTFTAKTTILKICQYIFNTLNKKELLHHIVNPSSLDYDVLYGRVDKDSGTWSDGVITKIIRGFSMDHTGCRKWLVLDGDLESSCIESVNSILEEDKFYLDSGEVLTLAKDTTLVFETETLNGSSPSTVSRCRMIYMDSSTLSSDLIATSWIKSCNSEWLQGHQQKIMDLLNWLIPPCLAFIANHCKQLCYPNQMNLVRNMLQLIEMILDEAYVSITKKEDDARNLWTWVQATLIQSGTLGLGSVLDTDSRYKFDEFYRQLWKGQNGDHPYPESFEKLEVGMPGDGLIFEYQFIYKQRGIWKMYQDLLKNEKVFDSPYMYEFLVPTVDSLRYQFLLTMYINKKCPILLIGPSSTGKTLLIEDILINKVDKLKYEVSHINFSTNTTARQLQTYILSKLNKRKAGYFTPPANKNFLLFIDNLHMADGIGSSASLELLRQHLDYSTWYDLKNSSQINLERVNVITAMRPAIRGLNNNRFLRHFNVFSINEFSDDTVTRIYTAILLQVWKKAGFPSDITTIISQIVSATIRVYNSIRTRCKPTISQCYYVFDLNNFTKVIKGCACLRKETFDANKKIHLKLWSHEILRVFGDRLNNLDHLWLLRNVKERIKDEFEEEEEEEGTFLDHTLIFGTIQDRELPVDNRRYEEILDQKNVTDIAIECLKHYNYYHREKLELIFFTYAIEKLTKICRIVSLSPGNALLLGSSGLGRQSLSKLAGYMYNQKIFQPKITQNYSLKEWNRHLKLVLKEAGGLEKQCLLLVGEEELIDELFLQNLDHLLTNGEILDFYDADERQEILELARLSAQGGNRNLDISSSDVFLYFNKRCKENMHLILCLNIGDSLRRRLRKHPALMNCHVVWCEDWPDQSLECIAQTRTENLALEDESKKKIIDTFVYFHRLSQNLAKETALTSKLQVHITSTAFSHLIKLFLELLTSKRFEISQRKNRYSQGLAKLSYAANQILNMQEALANYQPQLQEMTQKAIDMTAQIALETSGIEKASDLVRYDEQIACEQAAVAQILKSECEAELAQAIPILEDAILALNTLKPSDITLVKSMKNPPDAIKLVMAAVCVIKDVKPDRLPDPSTGRKILDYWGPSKRILGDMNFLQSLKDFDKDHIKDELMVKIRKEYLPHKDFKPQVVAKASSAAEGLCKWIIAMDMYDMVAKEVAPKKEKLEQAEMEYGETMAVLNGKKEEVARLEEKLATLNDSLAEAKRQQVKLQREVNVCNKKLMSAQKLIDSLSGERERWTEAVEDLERLYVLLEGDVLISSGVIAYLTPFEETDRVNAINTWIKYIQEQSIPCSKHFDIIKTLGSNFKFDSLGNDFFVSKIVMKQFSQYYTIFIDPQYQTSLWVQRIEKRNKLTITEFCHNDYLTHLKDCIMSGKPILIHKIKNFIPPCLNSFFSKQIYEENNEFFVEINDEYVKVDSNFRIYMVSNLDFPVFASAAYKRITVINFSLTQKSLGDKLLKIVSEIEKPELKKLKKELKLQTSTNTSELLELEEKILTILCESDILDDEASIKILDQSKDLAKIVRAKQEESAILKIQVEESRNVYYTVAEYAAFLFYCINDLKKLNVIYEFSLDWYTDLFFKSVLKSRRSKDINERCEYIKKCFTYDIFYTVNMALLQKDKLTFLFILTTRVMLYMGKISQEQLIVFLKCESFSTTAFIEESKLLEIIRKIETLIGCDDFVEHFTNYTIFWKQFLEKVNIRLVDFPMPWNDRLDNFKKLLLLKLLRKDQLVNGIKEFVGIELGERFTHTIHYTLTEIYNESYSLSPVLIFVTPGTNAMAKAKNLVAKKKLLNRFKWLPLANSTIIAADDLIEEARKQGGFIFLENCHLVPDWLETLNQRIVEMDIDNTHENFRLWLTTTVTTNIPKELLQTSIKIVDEKPSGLKENLRRLYKSEPINDPNFYSGCPGKQKIFARLLYGVGFFHCLLEEKKKFGVFGWDAPYFFDEEDFGISLKGLQFIVNEDDFSIDYLEKLKYIIEKCCYSGKLDNVWDIRMVSVIFDACVNSQICKSGKYWFNDTMPYGLPPKNDYKDHLNYISKLPENDKPHLFGINELEMAFNTIRECKELIGSSLIVLRNQDIEVHEQTDLYLLESVLTMLPSKLDGIEVGDHVIASEVKRYNILLDVIQKSLTDVRKAVGGDLEISFDIEQTLTSILGNSFPVKWLKYSYPHQLSLSSYIEDLRQRIEFFKKLSLRKNRFWLPAFFLPRALLCQIMVDISKKDKATLENLLLHYVVNTNNPDDSEVAIEGMFSRGAKWDEHNNTLTASSTLYEHFPPLMLRNGKVRSKEALYECPVYRSEDRLNYNKFLYGCRNFITSILLPTEVDPSYWTKRGVKLVCQVSNED